MCFVRTPRGLLHHVSKKTESSFVFTEFYMMNLAGPVFPLDAACGGVSFSFRATGGIEGPTLTVSPDACALFVLCF